MAIALAVAAAAAADESQKRYSSGRRLKAELVEIRWLRER